jgi:hypothetical protein
MSDQPHSLGPSPPRVLHPTATAIYPSFLSLCAGNYLSRHQFGSDYNIIFNMTGKIDAYVDCGMSPLALGYLPIPAHLPFKGKIRGFADC